MCYLGEYVRTVVVEPLEVSTLAPIECPDDASQVEAIQAKYQNYKVILLTRQQRMVTEPTRAVEESLVRTFCSVSQPRPRTSA